MKWLLLFLFIPFISFANTNTVSSTVTGTTTIDKQKSPVPTANSPSIVINQNDICKYGMSGAVQTQILGISTGVTIEDLNCERIKLSRMLFQQGLKVASVSILCEDKRVFIAMKNAGTWCPFNGKIGDEAKELWEQYPEKRPDYKDIKENDHTLLKWSIVATILGYGFLF
jgi:hypothetical protein